MLFVDDNIYSLKSIENYHLGFFDQFCITVLKRLYICCFVDDKIYFLKSIENYHLGFFDHTHGLAVLSIPYRV